MNNCIDWTGGYVYGTTTAAPLGCNSPSLILHPYTVRLDCRGGKVIAYTISPKDDAIAQIKRQPFFDVQR